MLERRSSMNVWIVAIHQTTFCGLRKVRLLTRKVSLPVPASSILIHAVSYTTKDFFC